MRKIADDSSLGTLQEKAFQMLSTWCQSTCNPYVALATSLERRGKNDMAQMYHGYQQVNNNNNSSSSSNNSNNMINNNMYVHII